MDELIGIANLEELWAYTNKLHKQMFPESTLAPIMAGGRLQNIYGKYLKKPGI